MKKRPVYYQDFWFIPVALYIGVIGLELLIGMFVLLQAFPNNFSVFLFFPAGVLNLLAMLALTTKVLE